MKFSIYLNRRVLLHLKCLKTNKHKSEQKVLPSLPNKHLSKQIILPPLLKGDICNRKESASLLYDLFFKEGESHKVQNFNLGKQLLPF